MFSPVIAAPRTDLNVALQLEPPNLDPTTGGAAAAIREVTYANIYEGLTRIDSKGSVQPDLQPKSWDISADGLDPTPSTCGRPVSNSTTCSTPFSARRS